jgi:hypothetical protein
MPLLRLTSLIIATLLVASLSAFVPSSREPHKTVTDLPHAPHQVAPAAVAMQAPHAGWTRVQGSAPDPQYGRELARVSGQSVPEAGQ